MCLAWSKQLENEDVEISSFLFLLLFFFFYISEHFHICKLYKERKLTVCAQLTAGCV